MSYNNWHHKLLHICIQKPYAHIIGMTSLACCLYPCTYLFLGITTQGIFCFVLFGASSVSWTSVVFDLLRWMRSRWTGLSWLLLCLLVLKTTSTRAFRFSLYLFYPTLPNINNNFIPGSFMIFYDDGQIVFGLMFMSTPFCACKQ